jgi:hypothetical protein
MENNKRKKKKEKENKEIKFYSIMKVCKPKCK